MIKSKSTVAILLTALLIPAFLGCRAKPAPDSGFLQDPKLMQPLAGIPYNRIWINPKYHDKTYHEIYVAPVNTDYVMAENVWEQATMATSNKADVAKNIKMLADYQRNAYIKACEKDPKMHFKVVDKPGPNTLILEMAIIQLVPSKAELQALGLVPVMGVGVGVTAVEIGASSATKSEDQGKGVIAMEARAARRRHGRGRQHVRRPRASSHRDPRHQSSLLVGASQAHLRRLGQAVCRAGEQPEGKEDRRDSEFPVARLVSDSTFVIQSTRVIRSTRNRVVPEQVHFPPPVVALESGTWRHGLSCDNPHGPDSQPEQSDAVSHS